VIEMVFFRVDDEFPDHPKVAGLPDAAIALWVQTGAWSARKLTDGFVPDGVATQYSRHRRRPVKALVDAGLWEPVSGGFQFHDWPDYNPTRAFIESRRSVDRVRKRRDRNPTDVRAESERSPQGIHTESEGIPSGVRAESLVPGTPTPTPSGWGGSQGAYERAHERTPARGEVPNPAQPVDKRARRAQSATSSGAERAKAEARARAVAACERCDSAGYIGAQVCDHGLSNAASDDARAAAMAEIRASLAGPTSPPGRSEGAP
jgi:hypothetical protein